MTDDSVIEEAAKAMHTANKPASLNDDQYDATWEHSKPGYTALARVAEALHADDCADDECDGGDMGHYERQATVALSASRITIPGRDALTEAVSDAFYGNHADPSGKAADAVLALMSGREPQGEPSDAQEGETE